MVTLNQHIILSILLVIKQMKVYFKPNTKKLKLQVKRLIFQKTLKDHLKIFDQQNLAYFNI